MHGHTIHLLVAVVGVTDSGDGVSVCSNIPREINSFHENLL